MKTLVTISKHIVLIEIFRIFSEFRHEAQRSAEKRQLSFQSEEKFLDATWRGGEMFNFTTVPYAMYNSVDLLCLQQLSSDEGPNYLTICVPPSKYPPRHFCAVCGYPLQKTPQTKKET